MEPVAFSGDRHESSQYGWLRDQAIRSLLDTHPVTATMLVSLGWFPTRKKALGRLRTMLLRKKVRLVGTVASVVGGPANVYCRWHPKIDHLRHELDVTEVCLRVRAGEIARGPALSNRSLAPDAELRINGKLFYLEVDRGTMRTGQIEGRFARYASHPELSLWVCADERRKEQMRRKAGRLRGTALFTTMEQALLDPHGVVWQDVTGNWGALPRHATRSKPWG